MYGLPRAGIIAQELLEKRLAEYQDNQWFLETQNQTDMFLSCRRQLCSEICESRRCRSLQWTQKRQNTSDSPLTGTTKIEKPISTFKHEAPEKIQTSPHPHVIPQYGAKTQYAKDEDESPSLSKEETKYVQTVAGTLLYYARVVDPTILTALSAIATEQAKPAQNTLKKVKQFLDYCATQDKAVITYNASKMILVAHSDAGYCNKKNVRSRAGGHFSLSNDEIFPPNNCAIQTNAMIIKAVMSSAAQAELGALYLNAKEAVYLWQILDEMGHPQQKKTIQTDNNMTAEGVINNKIQPKCTKAMDMRFHWLRDREAQGQLRIY